MQRRLGDMTGTEQVRLCEQCDLHVYNIAELTRSEATSLIANNEGRQCVRLYRRIDGTLLTRDCPVGLRALRRRVARTAGAALAAVIGLYSVAAGQGRSKDKQDKESCSQVSAPKITRQTVKGGSAVVGGQLLDPAGADIAGVKITLSNESTNEKLRAESNDMGEFSLTGMSDGQYTLEFESPGFKLNRVKHLTISAGEIIRIELILEVGEVTMGAVVTAEKPISNEPMTTKIPDNSVRKLPVQK